tara:strand:- start:70685 stop:71755 length:1071 start_codon:yes stop_codon:yes gene_type:complete
MSNGLPILTGLGSIVNPDNVKQGIDLKELERTMMKGGIITETVQDPSERLNEEIKLAAQNLGIDFGTPAGSNGNQNTSSVNSNFTTNSPIQKNYESSVYSRETVSSPLYESNVGGYGGGDNSGGDYGGGDNSGGDYGSGGYGDNGGDGGYGDNGDSLLSRTLEEERRSHINKIIGEESSFSLEKEKKEDLKCMMLAEIDSLISSLEMEEVDLSRIPKVSNDSPYEMVENTLKILRYKNDQTRCCTFMEEVLMFGAYGLEELFNGKNVWFGRYSPDITGWHNHLNLKLRRVRYDTGQFTSNLMENYKIGPGTRMALEIVPNLFLYSRMRKQQHSQSGLFAEADEIEVEQATARISSL